MKKYPFDLATDEDLIVLPALLDGYEIQLALDTAATQTIIDFNILLLLGYDEQYMVGKHLLETANGIMEASIFKISSLQVFDLELTNMEITSYDFLQKGLASSYDGVLGLDFFRLNKQGQLIVDFQKNLVYYTKKKK
jgi:gag-polyprotein putative aspartyl protease